MEKAFAITMKKDKLIPLIFQKISNGKILRKKSIRQWWSVEMGERCVCSIQKKEMGKRCIGSAPSMAAKKYHKAMKGIVKGCFVPS